LGRIGRFLGITLSLGLLAVGGLALGLAFAPESGGVQTARNLALQLVTVLAGIEPLGLSPEAPQRFEAALSSVLLRFVPAGVGAILLITCLLPGRSKTPKTEDEFDAALDAMNAERSVADGRNQKKAKKAAVAAAKSGDPHEAAEICFSHNLFAEAIRYYVEAEEFERAAEIHHDQNRFLESAELYLKARRFDSAGTIFDQQGHFDRAGDAYLEAGNQSVAGEMYEKAEDFPRAASCYAESGFPRHAAQCFVKCEEWEKAAACLEDVILEEAAATKGDERKQKEVEKLVRMAGKLYARAKLDERAQAVLEKGGCYGAAGEIALRNGRQQRAAELFLEARETERAASVMRSLGDDAGAARVLAEHHRDQGDDQQAATCYEEAEEFVAAGDLYRLLENYERAGECYERHGDRGQAAEMYRMAGDRERAADNYEKAGAFAESAECWALAGNSEREAAMLDRAGKHLAAGEIHHRDDRDDEAISALQRVAQEDPEFPAASALLGEIFRDRGMLNLALEKLTTAIGQSPLERDNLRAYFALATVHEANQDGADAMALYGKILAFDFNYEDVEARLARMRELADEQAAERQRAQSASATPTPTGVAGRYKIVGKLGRGGMGIVYKAEDTVLERVVAFKVLPEALKENPQALKNFLREAKSAAQLNHPNIVTVYDAGEQDGVYYIAMEYVDGSTLKEIVRQKGPVSPTGILHVLSQMCEGLAFAHEKRIVHRDVKTANTMWTRDRKAKIMDFGLAKVVEEVRNHTTVVSGTPYYMSPEQTLGKNVDHRTDIYSLGVTIFEMATGTLPFREGNLPYHHVHTPPPDPREFRQDLPEGIAKIVLRCLEKDPADRFQSAGAVLDEIKQISSVGV
jgi:tetratricopeptide (TPR) repeat protein